MVFRGRLIRSTFPWSLPTYSSELFSSLMLHLPPTSFLLIWWLYKDVRWMVQLNTVVEWVALLLRIWEISSSTFALKISTGRVVSKFSPQLPEECPGYFPKLGHVSFCVLPNSLFMPHTLFWRYICWAIESIVK
jgi:hypothetical protein